MARTNQRGRRRSTAGFTYLEVLCSVVFLALALLGHATSTITEHQMAEVGQARSEAVYTARQFVERVRADEDFPGLLSRIAGLQLEGAVAGVATLQDGRTTHSPSAYCPDFIAPAGLESLSVRVEIPFHPDETSVLREDHVHPDLDLPGDLNGDGLIDSTSRNEDYRALPVTFLFRWAVVGRPSAELRISTWLRGTR